MMLSEEQEKSASKTLRLSIVKGSAIGLLLPVVGVLKSIILIPILLSALGEHVYGIYVLTATGIAYALIVAGFGLDSSMYRFCPARFSTDGARSIASACLAMAVMSGTLVFALGALAFMFFMPDENYHRLPLIAGGICFCQAIWAVCFAYERARDRLVRLVLATVVFNFLEFSVYVAAAWFWRDIEVMFTGILLLNIVWTIVWLARQVRFVGISFPAKGELLSVASFGAHTVVNTLVIGAFLTIDKFLLGAWAGPSVLAFYAPAAGLAQILGSLASLSLMSVPHLLSRAHDEGRAEDIQLILRHGLNIYLCLAVPAVFGLCVTARPILDLLIGQNLAIQGAPIAMLFAVALSVLGLQRFPSQYLRVCGYSSWVNLIAGATLGGYVIGLSIALLLEANLAFGIPAIYLLLTVVQTVVVWNRARSLGGPQLSVGDAIMPVLLSGAAIAPGLMLDLNHWPTLVVYIIAAALLYSGLVAVWWRSRLNPRQLIFSR